MPTCSVPYCVNASNKDSHITFHEFPHQTPLFLSTWIRKIGRPNWRPGLRSVVCSEHFEKSDFDRSGKLRIGSCPIKFPLPPFRKKKKIECTNVEQSAKITVKSKEKSGLNIPGVCRAVNQQHKPVTSLNKLDNEAHIEFGTDDVKVENVENEIWVDCGNHSSEDSEVHSKIPAQAFNNAQNEAEVMVEPAISMRTKEKEPPTSKICVKQYNRSETIKRKRTDSGDERTICYAETSLSNVTSSFSLLACRVCGHISSLNTPIFGKDGLKADYAALINKYLPIRISKSDSLPLNICDGCISCLKVCRDVMIKCEETNDLLIGKTSKQQDLMCSESVAEVSSMKSAQESQSCALHSPTTQKQMTHEQNKASNTTDDTLVIYKQTATQKSNANGVSRILLLEMAVQDQVPVKTMINQAIEELQLRLMPKESRKAKPYGRIMFLDLQGGRGAYPEQMSKAVAMMFANGSAEEKFKVAASLTNSSTRTSKASPQATKFTPPIMKHSSKGITSKAPVNTSGLQATPVLSSVPLAVLQETTLSTGIQIAPLQSSSISTAVTCNTLPHANINTVLSLPSQGFPNVIQLQASNSSVKGIQASIQLAGSGIEPVPQNFPQLLPVPISNPINVGVQNIPPLIPLKDESVDMKTVPIDIASLREKVLTKIDNKGKQFKLGDKIVGIVLRNSDSSEEIQKKLQATFSKGSAASKTSAKQKERLIAPKGSEGVSVAGTLNIESTPASDLIESIKRPKEPNIEICSTPDAFCSYFERRYVPKPTLSFIWRKTAYLASSYQKLFTWVCSSEPDISPVLSCRVCKFNASSKLEVENHLQSHPDLQCTICQKYFLTVEKVHEHVQVIHLLSPAELPKKKSCIWWRQNVIRKQVSQEYQCSRCERRYKHRETLERHSVVCKQKTLAEKVIALSNAKVLSCPVCYKNMSTSGALQEHMLIHTKRTSWLCDICGLVLKTQSNYRAHTARHEEFAHEFKYQCKFCKKRFKLLNRFTEHEKTHEVSRQFICPSCGKVFRTPNGLRQHEILHGERKLQCRYCPSRFHRRDHLRIHEGCHNKPASSSRMPRNFRCRFCPSSEETGRFPNMKQLMDHYAEAHELERGKIPGCKKYSCDRCPRTFINSTLLRHHYMWHAGERPYNCAICGAGFMVKERLRNHENIHTNERPHKCPTCGKGFRSRHVLKQHKKVHSDPSTHFRCQFCQKGFSRIDNLRTHELVHTGVKPWKCIICLRQFRIRADCAKHISVNHQLSSAEVQLNIENVAEQSAAFSEPLIDEAAVKSIASVESIEFLLEEDDELEEEEEAIG